MANKAELSEALRPGCDWLGRKALDEPVFILRSQGILAPRVVVRWAHLAQKAGSPQEKVRGALQPNGGLASQQPTPCQGAGPTDPTCRFGEISQFLHSRRRNRRLSLAPALSSNVDFAKGGSRRNRGSWT